jgi:protein-S-isoprenylcysteine O-methyltransferase Ste14
MLFLTGNPVSMAVVVAGWATTQIGLATRYGALRKSGVQPAQGRDRITFVLFAVQSASVIAAFWGTVQVEPDFLGARGEAEIAIVGALVLAGVGFFVSALIVLDRNFALFARVHDEGRLVTNGPYAVVRNPIYLGYFLILLATPLAFGHPRSLLIALPLYLVGAAPRILLEERVLREHFGAAYDSYAARAKRLIPFVW